MSLLKPEEIQLLGKTLALLHGAELQNVFTSSQDVILELRHKGTNYYLWFEDFNLRPSLSFWPEKLPLSVKRKVLPLQLFLKAHFVGLKLEQVHFFPEYGRMLKLHFSEDSSLEFRVFPHGQNVIAKKEERSMCLHRPKELQKLNFTNPQSEEVRSVEEFSLEWLQERRRRSGGGALKVSETKKDSDLEKQLSQKKKKLKKAIEKVSAELENKEADLWGEAGNWLKSHGDYEDLPKSYSTLVDRRRSVHWNVDQLFAKSKDVKRKKEGTKERLFALEKELKNLEKQGVKALEKKGSSKSLSERKTPKDPANARSFKLSSDVKIMCGKSAKDNLKLLRQAKAWDLWFHMRDQPSSHGVVFKPKNKVLGGKEEDQLAQWFLKQVLGPSWKSELGQVYEILIAECRFVKPIKGDKIGRVTFHGEKVLRVKVKGS